MASNFVRFVCLGAAAVIATTSLAAALTAVRSGAPVEPYVWVGSPLPDTACASAVWHVAVALAFGWGSTLLIYRAQPLLRSIVAAVLGCIALLALKDSAVFLWLIADRRIMSRFPLPLSLLVACLAGAVAWRCRRQREPVQRTNRIAVPLAMIGAFSGVAGLVLSHLLTFGATDYSRHADVAIVLGAKVYSDGTPSLSLADRLRTAIDLYEQGRVRFLLMTGGTGDEGPNEALSMRDFAIAAGVPADQILIDEHGVNTLASARNCRPILADHGLSTALIVSHYYHLARCKMAFTDQRIPCTTVPARMSMRLVREPYYVVRECAAYLAYAIERPFRSNEFPENESVRAGPEQEFLR